ncbi:MAG: class I SAM-dependent methyltransferase [Caldimonas sp.]
MNDLEAHFRRNTGRRIHKWMHYFEIYDRHFARFRRKAPTVLEFGVSQGGSLQMWKEYFGAGTRLFGADINPECKRFEEDGVRIFIGDQADRKFLRALAATLPPIDILIDDGGHTMEQQIATFEELFGRVAPNGVYLCEDLHTSYWRRWGGGYRKRGSFIEYSKNWVDALHAWHSRAPRRLQVSDFTRTAHSLHYYDSVLVVEKRPMQPPHDEVTGTTLFPDWAVPPRGVVERLQRMLKRARGK